MRRGPVDIDVQVPDLLRGPILRSHDELRIRDLQDAVGMPRQRAVDLAALTSRRGGVALGAHDQRRFAECRELAVHAQLHVVGIGFRAGAWLHGHASRAELGGHRRVDGHAVRDAGVGVRDRYRGSRHWTLPRLDHEPVFAQGSELARALEIVVNAVDGGQVRIAPAATTGGHVKREIGGARIRRGQGRAGRLDSDGLGPGGGCRSGDVDLL